MLAHRAANAQQFGQALEGLDKTHDRQAVHRKHAVQTLLFHQGAADTLYLQVRETHPQCREHPRAENIPGGFTSEHTDAH